MAQVAAIIDTLKSCLKAHGLRYVEVAQALNLSEASVKRLFRMRSFDLEQLQAICQLMGMEISDLIQTMQQHNPGLVQLSLAQEEEIAKDPATLLIAVCVLNRWTAEEMVSFYRFKMTDIIRKLALLDKLNIIELLPNNHIKLKVAANFHWQPNGPIAKFFKHTIERELFNADFEQPANHLAILNGMLSPQSTQAFQLKLNKLAQEFDQLNNADAALDVSKRDGVTLVLAMRDWHYTSFQRFIRT
ncbi:helix-turn-helix transcriptional regulator [Simiduia curdlanivorans]|uniref:Helix-turn-helix domain-containing protein n=1 Tax=Simiduia curdlanivorans TaxID=1492769 RepID=A0ABV8V1N7_9GAMM|nr:helix-turn-helix transcriptional regulator [Simiduia curdlanivorans]MDN3639170.1 helix-turn-helix transcriptional regulator [Simiduia curdlanivorans]